ncbi:hypothetical protein [Parasulfitobacter algicola]|uniref:Uncharacterized protein n=1 Tax=Parasulfitobacter algicola TaxID=2614809 RepID=A0ABX2IRG4_9RHOB|nr:hypothetical protein [Sulfitobacter algicola]NSX55110.1 hypothetical protein [Sulfitobacter algicola]
MDITANERRESIEGAFDAIWLFGQKAANAFALQIYVTLLPAFILGLAIVGLIVFYRQMVQK